MLYILSSVSPVYPPTVKANKIEFALNTDTVAIELVSAIAPPLNALSVPFVTVGLARNGVARGQPKTTTVVPVVLPGNKFTVLIL